jgi:hypothetical protein
MNKVRELATIAAIRELADELKAAAPEINESTKKLVRVQDGPVGRNLLAIIQEEADLAETIYTQLNEMADDAAHFRAYMTARHIVGPLCALPAEEAVRLRHAVQKASAYLEHTAPLPPTPSDEEDRVTCTVRLVPFYDSGLDEERWAVEYTNTDDEILLADNAEQADAEWRFWQIAEPLGAVNER